MTTPVSHFRPHSAVSSEILTGYHPPPSVLLWFGSLWLLLISKNEIEAERTPVLYHWEDPVRISEGAWHFDRKGIPESVPKMETVWQVSICGRELLRGWWRPIGLTVSFMIFTASVWNILDKPLYKQHSYVSNQFILDRPLYKQHSYVSNQFILDIPLYKQHSYLSNQFISGRPLYKQHSYVSNQFIFPMKSSYFRLPIANCITILSRLCVIVQGKEMIILLLMKE
jgi:hypothetical protein